MMENDTYTPVPWEFREMLDDARKEKKDSVIHFFVEENQIDSVIGEISEVKEIKNEGEFLIMKSGEKVRLDKVITLYGKPGPAYEKYDSFANACLECTGGYDL
jgi:hypothetical protein